jgi:clan AA aspartic protease
MAEEKGIVNESLEAVVNVKFTNGSMIECAIDTGFNGWLLLPRRFIEENSMRFIGLEKVTMVEENEIFVETALAKVNWLESEFSTKILVSETEESLIGTQMLANAVLEIDYENVCVKITKR